MDKIQLPTYVGQLAVVNEAKINNSNLRLRTFIGFNPDEKTKTQDVIVKADIGYRPTRHSRAKK